MASFVAFFNRFIIANFDEYRADSWNPNHLLFGDLIGSRFSVSAEMLDVEFPDRVIEVEDMQNLSRTDASRIIEKNVWNEIRGSKIEDQRIADIIAFYAVNLSPKQAITNAQILLSELGESVQATGQMDPKTLASLNGVDPEIFHDSFKRAWQEIARDQKDPAFGNFLLDGSDLFEDQSNNQEAKTVNSIDYSKFSPKGGMQIIKIAFVVAIVAAALFFGWRYFQNQ